ncbi:MAG: LysR family transcriptional regulator [Rhodospirillales bacterium 69-11]|nr:LysR family transcriptional regulator [Rhodospirillales bacterium]OJW31448.1 MAG: LysR family transcriptional regulator [Rhodospirillales bacterium 69-11]
MPLPDLEAWAIFAKIAETGSFAAAAAELGLSGPTVSKALSRLEARFGERLIHRTSRRFALTETGRILAVRAAQILAEGEAVEAEAQAKSAAPRGRIRVAAPMSFGLRHVAPALPEFLATYPEVAVDLRLDDQMIDLVAGGIDLALRIASLPDSSLIARRLCAVQLFLVGSPAYFAAHGMPVRPRDLGEHACLLYSNSPRADLWRFRHRDGAEESVAVKGRLTANSADALSDALEAGAGVALQPDFICWEALAAGRLVAAMTDWAPAPLGLHMVTPAGGPRPIRVRVLAEFLVRRFSSGAAPWTRAA